MNARRRKEKRDVVSDYINDAIEKIYTAYCGRVESKKRPVKSGLGGFTAYDPPAPEPVIVHVPISQIRYPQPYASFFERRNSNGFRTSARFQVNHYARHVSYEEGWHAPKASAPRAKPKARAKPADHAPPPPPPPSPKLVLDLDPQVMAACEILQMDIDTATTENVRKIRRALALKYHSDRGGSDSLMSEVNAAADILIVYLESKKKSS